MDWSGSEVSLALGAPDLYPIRNKAKESVHDTKPIGNSNGSTFDSLSVLAIESRTPAHSPAAAVAFAVAHLHLYLSLWCYI